MGVGRALELFQDRKPKKRKSAEPNGRHCDAFQAAPLPDFDHLQGLEQVDDFGVDTAPPEPPADRLMDMPVPQAEQRAPDHTWRYRSRDGKEFAVNRIDAGPGIAKSVWQPPRGVKLEAGDKWLPYMSGGEFARDRPVVVVEGEKCADAVKALTGDGWNVLTCQRGAKQSDWSMLEGHDVYLWPDSDVPGFKKLHALVEAVRPVAQSIKIVQAGGRSKDDAANFIERNEPIAPLLDNAWPLDDLALKPIARIEDVGLWKCLNFLNFKLRYNLRADRSELCARVYNNICGLKKDEWTELTDLSEGKVKETIRKQFAQVKIRFQNGREKPYLSPAIFGRDRWADALNSNLA